MEQKQATNGRRRKLHNRFSVKLGDVAARVLITIGGIGTIIAVSGVFLFLTAVVLPLFLSAKVDQEISYTAPWASSEEPLHVSVDEYQVLGMAFFGDGMVRVFRLDTGEMLQERQVLEDGPQLTATSFAPHGDGVAFGFADGTVRLGRLGFMTQFPNEAEIEQNVEQLQPGEFVNYDGGVLQRTAQGEVRAQKPRIELKAPVEVASAAIERISHLDLGTGPLFVAYTEDGKLLLNSVRERENLLTGEIIARATAIELPFEPYQAGPPDHVMLSGEGDNVLVAWEDGFLRRYDVRNFGKVSVAEELDLLTDENAKITAIELLLGRSTLLVGDSTGQTRAWFRTRPRKTTSTDGTELTAAHELPGSDAAVTSLATSARSRMTAIGYADGQVRVYYVPTSNQMAAPRVAADARVSHLLITPKDDGLFAIAAGQGWHASFDPRHPEASLGALFLPVWYEGYNEADHVWQSGGGTESLEPKLGLWPLVFGTLKATFYSMLFGVPIALLAAVFTSEFLHPRTRAKIKPTIELMASLPSVVLGFLAALVFAPLVENILPSALSAFITVPVAFLIGAYLWQLLPYGVILRIHRWRLLLMAVTLPFGLLAAYLLGPAVERWLFAGDIIHWLDGQIGTGVGAWMLLFLPLASIAMASMMGLFVNSWVRSISYDWSRQQLALATLVKFVLGAAVTVGVAWLLSWTLTAAGFDPRGSFVDTFDQRNALVVGFIMGFAIIPIIFTIADDALSSVPQHLRSGSLGAGATQWQTAVRIVIPTAMSGLFSAVMIGLGRAVGETMIVLMAAGNTPVRDWNIFNGFRTLSATIAVELPEAARNSTHFRTLFLAALTLFLLTFLVNTVAEVVRLRFRRRAYQL